MNDGTADNRKSEKSDDRKLMAHRCQNGHLNYPAHPACTTCGESLTETVDLTDSTGEVVTWTRATTTPPGVREPNTLAIVEFTVDDASVRVLGGTTDKVEIGQHVVPVFVEQLRDPEQAIRHTDSQSWSGFRFEPETDS